MSQSAPSDPERRQSGGLRAADSAPNFHDTVSAEDVLAEAERQRHAQQLHHLPLRNEYQGRQGGRTVITLPPPTREAYDRARAILAKEEQCWGTFSPETLDAVRSTIRRYIAHQCNARSYQ